MDKARELQEELQAVFSGRAGRLLDSAVPVLIFIVLNALLGSQTALWGALAAGGLFTLMRLIRGESVVYALAGFGGVAVAALLVQLSGAGSVFFLPGLISKAVTIVLCVVSVVVRRPLVAWTSILTRRWPRDWYWHPRVLPAYSEVTLMWGLAFAGQLALEYWLYQENAVNSLGVTRLLLGWPFTVVLLVVTYLYGLWRLGQLNGPSVEEFKSGAPPPWEGQTRGF
jgi:hypothetical protein